MNIRSQADTIFEDQRSDLESQVDAIHSTADTMVQQHNQRVEAAIEQMSKERANHLTIMGSKRQTMDNAHQQALIELNTKMTQF